MSILIRPGLFYDVEIIANNQVKMAFETEKMVLDLSTVTKGVQAVIDDPSKGNYWVAEVNGQVVGCLLTVPEWSDWRSSTILWIHSVYVNAENRGQGIYKSLYEKVKTVVADSEGKYCGIRLYVDKSNKAAQKVYTKLGMNGEHYTLYEWMP